MIWQVVVVLGVPVQLIGDGQQRRGGVNPCRACPWESPHGGYCPEGGGREAMHRPFIGRGRVDREDFAGVRAIQRDFRLEDVVRVLAFTLAGVGSGVAHLSPGAYSAARERTQRL